MLGTLCFAAYALILSSYFVADDFGYIQLYHQTPWSAWPKLFVADWSQGIWGVQLRELRPLIALTYLWDAFVWQSNPLGYHLTNVLFHALNTVLVFLLARWLAFTSERLALLAASLFALHPVHIEAVAWTIGRVELISTFFYLGSLLLFALFRRAQQHGYYLASLSLFLLGLFSKEMVISLPLLVLIYDYWQPADAAIQAPRRRWLAHLGFIFTFFVYLCFRRVAFAQWLFAEVALTQRRAIKLLWRQLDYVNALVLPVNMLEYQIRLRWLGVVWLVLLLLLAWQLFIRRRALLAAGLRNPLWFFGPLWYLVTILPLLNTYRSPRHLYLPSVGFCIVLVLLLERLFAPRVFKWAVVLLLLGYSVLLLRYDLVWREAGRLSASVRAEIESAARELPAGGGLILAVPWQYKRSYLWAWAVPFALRAPFTSADLDERQRVLEGPLIYCCAHWKQAKTETLRSLIEQLAEAYLISLDESGLIAKRKFSAAQTKAHLSALRAELEQAESAERTFNWTAFWTIRLKSPSEGGSHE